MNNEQAFIAAEQIKQDAVILKQLFQIDRKGTASRKIVDRLWINGLICGCGPRPGINNYNGYRLSEAGFAMLAKLQQEVA